MTDVRAQAEAVRSVADLARLLRTLRRRQADRGSSLGYRQIAARTGMSPAVVGFYLTGSRLADEERFTSLVEVLGADPMERVALTSALRRLTAAAAVAASWPGGTTTPQALPARPAAFTGRSQHLAQLDELIDPVTRKARFAVITGMAGVGKTAVALHWAHRAANHFPHGQIYADLHTYSKGEPLSVMDTLGVLLTSLGVDLEGLADLTTRSLRYQTLLRGRSTLVVLDNVGSRGELTHLLPPAPCVAIVTSRDEITHFDDGPLAARLELAGLSEVEALDLLRLLVGSRVDDEPVAVRALAARCAYLPLAVRVAAEHAAALPQLSLAELVDDMAANASGLTEFEVPGDSRADLSSVFSWSLHRLPAPLARAFHLFGLVPGFDIDRYGLAALVGVDPVDADELAEGLVAAHLLEPRGAGRFAMHDLLRAYAQGSAPHDLTAEDRHEAMTRLLDYYLSAVTVVARTVAPNTNQTLARDRPVPTSEVPIPDLLELDAALAWLDAERANTVAACVHAARSGWPAHAVATAIQLWTFLEEAHAHDAVTLQIAALAAADEAGAADARDRAFLLAALSLAYLRLGDLDQAGARVEESIAVSHRAADESQLGLSLTILGAVRSRQGRFIDVLAAFEQVLEVARSREPIAQIIPLVNLGEINLTLERYEVGADYYRQAASLAAATQQRQELAEAHRGVAAALVLLGRSREAVPIAEQAVEVSREYGFPIRLAVMLDTLAQACRESGRVAEAIDHLTEAVQLCREMADAGTAAQVLNTLGETYLPASDHLAALSSHEEAFECAERASDRKERARALVGLGDTHAALGNVDRAQESWQEALDEYTDMGLPAAVAVLAQLRTAREVPTTADTPRPDGDAR